MTILWKQSSSPVPTNREQMIPALLAEREGYVKYGRTDRVRAVDEQLAAYGYDPKAGFQPTPVDDGPSPDEQDLEQRRAGMVRALLAERAEYKTKKLPDRVRLVDEQLQHYGYEGGS
ncbi:hypothetical protein ABT040_30180 [Streptomyces sp. NPDC002688]|uniref:hypothetical protein n=1 Tax=Streptomyces sp. NPDC002688 TaxID=3154423 RepID=UPI0033166420